MHDGDAERLRLLRRSELDKLSADENRPGRGPAGAANDPDQRRLAGAVLSQQRVHLTAPDREIDVVERPGSGEILDHSPDLEDDLGV